MTSPPGGCESDRQPISGRAGYVAYVSQITAEECVSKDLFLWLE